MRRLPLLLPLVLLLAPVGASAQTPGATEIDGSPLNVFTDASGRLQARLDGTTDGEFFPSGSDSGNAGFVIALDPQGANIRYGGFNNSFPAPDSPPTLTPGNPATITTVWTLTDPSSGSPLVRVTQKLVYANGSRQFDAQHTVENISGAPISFRAWEAADLSIRGSDSGFGFLSNGPPRFMGGVNQDVGAIGGLVEETPWSAFESNSLSAVSNGVGDSTGPGLDNSISPPPPVDNAAAVQWDQFYPPSALAAGQTAQFNVGWRFTDTLGLSPLSATELTGAEHVVTATVNDVNGAPQPGQTIVFNVLGANPNSGKVVSDSKGQAQFSWVGGNPGDDIVTAFVDQNKNGTRDPNEPQSTASVSWLGPSAPIPGVNVVARVEKGVVKVKLPKGASLPKGIARKWAPVAAAGRFVPLNQAGPIPIGSTVDTTRGTVRLTAATGSSTSSGGQFSGGSFNGSQFLVGQSKRGGIAQMSLTGGGLGHCAAPLPKGGAARARHRRLFSSVHGRFRTRGRNASATVRGTQWTMTDTCKGTQIAVKQGTVVVRDFTLRKNKVVRAGHKYLAKAPKRRHRR